MLEVHVTLCVTSIHCNCAYCVAYAFVLQCAKKHIYKT